MVNNKKILAIIPARGGSKRLPRKNVLDLAGKPLITWTIEAGLKSRYIDKVVVTTDDDEIVAISTKNGAAVIKRPVELATDSTPTFEAVKHVIDNMDGYDYVLLLQPTSPLRTNKHIDEAIALLFKKSADAVISVCEAEHSPLWANTLPDDLSMKHFLNEHIKNKRSQDLPAYYYLNGAIYMCQTKALLTEQTFFIKNKLYAYIMRKESSVDVDCEYDLKLAEFFMARYL